MKLFYLVYCKYCGSGGTAAFPPEHINHTKKVMCCQCGEEIDATIGRAVIHPTRIRKQPAPDLLEVF